MPRETRIGDDPFPEEPEWNLNNVADEVVSKHERKRTRIRRVIAGVAGIAGAVGLAYAVSYFIPNPICEKGKGVIAQVRDYENSPNLGYSFAEPIVEYALSNPKLCNDDRQQLQREAAILGLELIYEHKYPPNDFYPQEKAVKQYAEWKERMKQFKIPPESLPSHWIIAKRAYDVDKFLLAKVVLEEAGSNGELNHLDILNIYFVYSTLRNLGYWYTQETREPYYTQGLQNLLAANEMTKRYGIGGEANQDLVHLLGNDKQKWPGTGNESLLLPGSLPDARR